MTKKEKQKAIEKITKQQGRLLKNAFAIPLKPSKRMDVSLRRLGKIMAIAMQVRALEMQKHTIIAQPIPNYVPGGIVPGGPAIVGEDGPEMIIKPGGFQVCPIGNTQHAPINKRDESTDQYTNSHQ